MDTIKKFKQQNVFDFHYKEFGGYIFIKIMSIYVFIYFDFKNEE